MTGRDDLCTATAPDCRALEARLGRAPGVRFDERFGGTVAILEAGGFNGRRGVARRAGVVVARRPASADDVLWLSPHARSRHAAKPCAAAFRCAGRGSGRIQPTRQSQRMDLCGRRSGGLPVRRRLPRARGWCLRFDNRQR